MAKREDSEKIVINVGGVRHETYKSSLKTLPGTRLALLAESVPDDDMEPGSISEFFFDRHPGMFTYILNYYRTGDLHFPPKVCGCLFEKELAFWGINETDMEPCCWVSYCTHRDRIEALRKLGPSDPVHAGRDRQNLLLLNPEDSGATSRYCSWPKIWALFDDPYSSKAAEVISVMSLVFLLVSIINACVGTYPLFREYQVHEESTPDPLMESDMEKPVAMKVFFILEAVCVTWFIFEFLVRVVSCPNKLLFIKNVLNTIDFVAILPFFFSFVTTSNIVEMVRAVRFLRLLRIFKLMRAVVCMQVMGHAVRASLSYFFILSASLAVISFMFGSLIFHAENLLEDNIFADISLGAWWAMITLTTIGYGDMYPVGWLGRVVACLCAVTGVLTLALPVPALVNNFRIYHKLITAKYKLSMKKRYNPDLSVPVALPSTSYACPMVTESIH